MVLDLDEVWGSYGWDVWSLHVVPIDNVQKKEKPIRKGEQGRLPCSLTHGWAKGSTMCVLVTSIVMQERLSYSSHPYLSKQNIIGDGNTWQTKQWRNLASPIWDDFLNFTCKI